MESTAFVLILQKLNFVYKFTNLKVIQRNVQITIFKKSVKYFVDKKWIIIEKTPNVHLFIFICTLCIFEPIKKKIIEVVKYMLFITKN